MTPPPGTLRKRRSVDDAKSAILDAAESIILDVGPGGLRIKEVARKARMAHPNVLHHFGSRDGLLEAVTRRALKRSADRVIEATKLSMGVPPEDRPATVTTILQSVYRGEQGKLIAWLFLSGLTDDYPIAPLDPLVAVVHAWRQAAVGSHDIDETRNLLILANYVLLGEQFAGKRAVEAFGIGQGDEGLTKFRDWFTKLLLAQT